MRHNKRFNLGILAGAELLAMATWFSASAVVPQLTEEFNLSGRGQSWMTMSVQIGFVVGALMSALFNLSDQISARLLFAMSALSGAVMNGTIPLLCENAQSIIAMRFLTGVTLAGVYPVGMKLMATWCDKDRGLGIGILVGALTFGSALPHLLNAIPVLGDSGMPPWRIVLLATSLLAIIAASLAALLIRSGPLLNCSSPFNWRFAAQVLKDKPTRLANFGYLGHMWELYAMWAWAPLFLIASYDRAGLSLQHARLAGFASIALGAMGCILAGKIADRFGRTAITIWSLSISGSCAFLAGFFFTEPVLLTVICLTWGFAVVADSAQFSTAVSELTDPRYVGTALTIQTSLGFALTLITLRLIPALVGTFGWERVFMILAAGPLFGIWQMQRLRGHPEALKMASGNR